MPKLARKLFPQNKFIYHEKGYSGLNSPYRIIKKLLVDLILIFDIYLLSELSKYRSIGGTIENCTPLKEVFRLVKSDFFEVSTLLEIYNIANYPLSQKVIDYNSGHALLHARFILDKYGAFLEQTSPLILGETVYKKSFLEKLAKGAKIDRLTLIIMEERSYF